MYYDGDGLCPDGENDYEEGAFGWCECNTVFDGCGVCGGNNECFACNQYIEPLACNGTFFDNIIHDPDACLFPGDEGYEGCDCNGNIEDCLGECGGDAELDECGECNGDGADEECWEGTLVCDIEYCPEYFLVEPVIARRGYISKKFLRS